MCAMKVKAGFRQLRWDPLGVHHRPTISSGRFNLVPFSCLTRMFRAAVSVTLAGMASAFLAPSAGKPTSQLKMISEDKSTALPFTDRPINLTGELYADAGFDPFGFTTNGDLIKYREAELKHGRLSMLAVVGVLVQEVYRLNENFPSKNFLEALKTAPALGLFQIILAISAIEINTSSYEGRVPGDLGFDPLALSKDGINEKWAVSEIKHGRLAMLGFLGFVVQQLVSPVPILEQTYAWAKSF